MLPFGIQVKGFIVGILFTWFALPMIMGMFGRMRGGDAPA